jgi:hypothetical protein
MQFTANIDYVKLSKAFEKIPLIASRELRSELNKGLRAIQIDARLHHRFKPHSGQLGKSILEDVSPSGLDGKVWLEESVAGYGKYVHDGTPPHKIFPKNKAALAFVKGGVQFIVPKRSMLYNEFGNVSRYWKTAQEKGAVLIKKGYVNHPGTKEDKFLFQAFAREKTFFLARIRGAAKRIFEAAGLK